MNNEEVSRKHVSETYLFGLFDPLALELFLKEKFNRHNRPYDPFRTFNPHSTSIRMMKKTNITKEEYLRMMDKIIRIKVNAPPRAPIIG